ncbi:MAG: apolipoprotein N-acyltransferase [Pseudomonadota bacterium]
MTARKLSWLALSLLSSLLVRLTLPTVDLAPLIFVAWTPLLIVSCVAPPRTAFLLGLAHGFLLGIVAHDWLVGSLLRNFPIPVGAAFLALAAVAALVALRSALVAFGVAYLQDAVPVWLSFPVLQMAAEQLLPGVFPWTTALAVSSVPMWQQAAGIGGAAAVSGWLCLTNALVAQAWLARHRSYAASGRFMTLAASVVAAMTALGALLMRVEAERVPGAPSLRIAVGHYDSSGAQEEPVTALRNLALDEQRAGGPPDLWVWPETTLGTAHTSRELTTLASDYLRRDSVRGPSAGVLEGPLLVGVELADRGTLQNSAVLFGVGGNVDGVYSKHVLMPVGETSALVPGLSLPNRILHRATPFRAGSDALPLSVAGHRLALSICFEDILPAYVFEQVQRSHAELLVNLTSDRWFKGTSAVDFHFALARLSAVEHRKYLVRSTRDGISGVVDNAGRVVERLHNHRSAVIVVPVPWLSGTSIADSLHRPLAILWPLVALVFLVLGALKRTNPHG